MYRNLPSSLKKYIPELFLEESQINAICKNYYKDERFCKNEQGEVSLWKLYNLFTSANKVSL